MEATKITVTLSDGSELVFNTKHQTTIKILKGTMDINNGNFREKIHNGREAIIIVNAPEEVHRLFRDDGDVMFYIEQELNK
jgi:hypothetical protein